jgi:hypothetical protein
MKNYQIILTSLLSFFVAFSILNGTAQQYVHFAGIENELGCAVIALTMGVLSLIGLDWKGFFNYLNK